MGRLEAYATFFATERSVADEPYRVLPLDQLEPDEHLERDRLLRELIDLRECAPGTQEVAGRGAGSVAGLMHFPPGEEVIIVCSRLPDRLLGQMPYADADGPDYVKAYTYADLDALIECFGHIRAYNPLNRVTFRIGTGLVSDDYTSHLVLLGGVDFNDATRDVLGRFGDLPVRQFSRETEDEVGGFEIAENGRTRTFSPKLRTVGGKAVLEEDVAQVFWARNPYNENRTVTICNGMYGRGVYGAVRAITDARLRDENQEYITSRFGDNGFNILSKVLVVGGEVVTPSWRVAEHRLHEWSVTR